MLVVALPGPRVDGGDVARRAQGGGEVGQGVAATLHLGVGDLAGVRPDPLRLEVAFNLAGDGSIRGGYLGANCSPFASAATSPSP